MHPATNAQLLFAYFWQTFNGYRCLSSFFSFILLTACAASQKQFGEVLMENTADPAISKQEIVKIKRLDNDVFTAASFTGKEQIEIKYHIYQPQQAQQQTDERYPLVVVFHGSGHENTLSLVFFTIQESK